MIRMRIWDTERILNWRGAGLIRIVATVAANVTDVVDGEELLRGLILPLHFFIVIKDSLDFSLSTISTTFDVTLTSILFFGSIDQKCHILLRLKCSSRHCERNASAWCGSGAFHIILASLAYLYKII
jgi:hypothetical protein